MPISSTHLYGIVLGELHKLKFLFSYPIILTSKLKGI